MLDAELDYIRMSGIPRQRRYFHWIKKQWMNEVLIDIGRSDGVTPSNLKLIREDRIRYNPPSDRAKEIYAYLEVHGPTRLGELSKQMGIPKSTIVSVAKTYSHMFKKRQVPAIPNKKGGPGVAYSIRKGK